jgi:hypothetical protein
LDSASNHEKIPETKIFHETENIIEILIKPNFQKCAVGIKRPTTLFI